MGLKALCSGCQRCQAKHAWEQKAVLQVPKGLSKLLRLIA